MLSQWLERARAGEPVWLPDMRAQCAQLPDPIDATMQLTLCDGTQRDFPLPLPRWESDDQRQFVLDNNLTERHARALLKLPTEESKLAAVKEIVRQGMSVARTEKYVETLLSARSDRSSKANVGAFLNSLTQSLQKIQQSGIPAVSERRETDTQIVLTITIPK